MNTEPPEGDDLQRMLVSMKRHVLERATPHPTRRRFRPGIVLGVVGLLAVGTATGAVALTLAQQDRPVAAPVQTEQPQLPPSDTTPTSAPITGRPTPRPTPTPTPTPNTVATIPTDCRSTVPTADYDRLFGDIPVRKATAGVDAPKGVSGTTALTCVWADPRGDVSGIVVQIGTATPEESAAAVEGFPSTAGGTCSPRDGGTVCQSRGMLDGYPVETASTYYVRGTTWISIDQTNVPTDNLLGALIATVWGD